MYCLINYTIKRINHFIEWRTFFVHLNVVFLIIFENEIILLHFIFVFLINVYFIFVYMPNDTNHVAEMYYILYYIMLRYENEL